MYFAAVKFCRETLFEASEAVFIIYHECKDIFLGGCYRPRWITPSEICLVLHILRKPDSLIALLFIQNNSQIENMLTCIDVKFIFDSVR